MKLVPSALQASLSFKGLSLPPSSSMTVHWDMDRACWLRKNDPGFQNPVPEETSSHPLLGAQDQRQGAGQDQLPGGSTGTTSGICRETETHMVPACHTPRQPSKNHPSGHRGGWATPWSAEEMLDKESKGDSSLPMPELPTTAAEKTGRGSLLTRPFSPHPPTHTHTNYPIG